MPTPKGPNASDQLGQLLRAAMSGTSLARTLLPALGGQSLGPYFGGLQGGLGLMQGIQSGNPIGAASGALQLAGAGGLLNNVPGAGLLGPALGIAGSALNGDQGSGLANSVTGLGMAGTAALAGAPSWTAGAVTSPIALMQLGNAIDTGEDANDDRKAAKRNSTRSMEARQIMQRLDRAAAGGRWDDEVSPGVKAGDLMVSIASAGSRGDLYSTDLWKHPSADEGTIRPGTWSRRVEGIMPKGEYETYAQELAGKGYRDLGMAAIDIKGGKGVGHVNNLNEFIAALDDTGGPAREFGQAYTAFQGWMDLVTKGRKPAFDADEAMKRSPMTKDKYLTGQTPEGDWIEFGLGGLQGQTKKGASFSGDIAMQIDQMLAQNFEGGNEAP